MTPISCDKAHMKMDENRQRDLLIVACSATKRPVSHPVPAIELYNGPAFRVLRKRLKLEGGQPTIYILSAKHGLIEANELVSVYDFRMNRKRALQIRDQVHIFLERLTPPGRFNAIFIWAGKDYLLALPQSFLARSDIHIAEGGIGKKLKQLREWCEKWSI